MKFVKPVSAHRYGILCFATYVAPFVDPAYAAKTMARLAAQLDAAIAAEAAEAAG